MHLPRRLEVWCSLSNSRGQRWLSADHSPARLSPSCTHVNLSSTACCCTHPSLNTLLVLTCSSAQYATSTHLLTLSIHFYYSLQVLTPLYTPISPNPITTHFILHHTTTIRNYCNMCNMFEIKVGSSWKTVEA